MKIVVINISGNVGKSTVARQLLAARMPAAVEFVIETLNAGAADDTSNAERLKAKDFATLQKQFVAHESVIVDIGASNAPEMIKQFGRLEGSHEDVDFYIVPVVAEDKQLQDSVRRIQTLSALGVPPHKIRLIFNKVDVDDADDLRNHFGVLFALHASDKSFTLNPDAVILDNQIFGLLRPLRKSLAEVFADETDYRSLIGQLQDEEAKAHAAEMLLAKRLAKSATRNLDDVFRALFKGVPKNRRDAA